MNYFASRGGDWTNVSSPPNPPYIEVDEETATLRFVSSPEGSVPFTGAPVDPDADTIHTVMRIDPSLREGAPLCAIYVRGTDLDLEDRRSTEAPSSHADALDQLRSALDEIMIPVYIDDAIEEISEAVDGLFALHTVQHDDGRDAPYTYFRTSVFQEGKLLLEDEYGAL